MDARGSEDHPVPLVVDVDYTLLKTDLLAEGLVHLLRDAPLRLPGLIRFFWTKGIVALKEKVWDDTSLKFGKFPFNETVVEIIQDAVRDGRKVVLCSASCQEAVSAVGAALGLDVECVGSSDGKNLKSSRKAEYLVGRFGENGFDYIGDSRADIPVWKVARRAMATKPVFGIRGDLQLVSSPSALVGVLRAFRFHQWAKNLLVFLPAIAGHAILSADVLGPNLLAFLSLGLVASGTYFLNDVFDIAADRAHPSKSERPIANGSVTLQAAVLLSSILILLGLIVAALINPLAVSLVIVYLIATFSYSLKLKTLPVVDVAALTGFYLLRVYIGGASVGILPSAWLATFCIFAFFSLACAKRATEIHRLGPEKPRSTRRSYTEQDYQFFLSSGVSSGLLSSVVIGLYVQGDMVGTLYSKPDFLILEVPLVAFWFARLWFLVHRGSMHDDPVAFALGDLVTWVVALCGFGLLLYSSI